MPPNPDSEEPGLPAEPDPGSPPTGDRDASGSESDLTRAGSSTADVTVEEETQEWDYGGGEPPSSYAHKDQEEPPEPGKMSFLDHLEELRRRILHALVAVAVGFVVCWTFADEIYAAIALPLTEVLRELQLPDKLVYTSPTAPFTLYVQLSLLAGLFVASPYIILQVWKFISPGLYPHERRYAIPFILLCSVLFVSGGMFAYAIAFPAALRFLLTFAHQFSPMITVNEYFSLAMTIILGLALVFELPILILFLTLLRLVTPRFLLRNTRYAILLIFVAAAVISPTGDVPNMMVFATPMIGLYFFGIALSWFVMRLRGRDQEG
jgi:sec-independent protein translocase protein TatC